MTYHCRNLYFLHRISVSSEQVEEYVDFPKFTFCPEWFKSTHAPGLFNKQVSVEDVQGDEGLANDFIKVTSPTYDEGEWSKSYRLITTSEDGYLWPCMTYTKPQKVRSDGAATEVYKACFQHHRNILLLVSNMAYNHKKIIV